jgi:hypothetical protein
MELWTPEHARTLIPSVLIMLLAAVGLRAWLGKKPFAKRMIPLQICSVLLLLLEVGKQVLSLRRGYDLYHLPFHYCSLFLFALPAMAFCDEKHRQKASAVATALCMAMFLLLMIYPNLIYGPWDVTGYFTDYFCFHTVTYHNLVVFCLFLILALGLYVPAGGKEHLAVLGLIGLFCAVSASMAHILKTNYANYYSCNIPVLETVRLAVADAVGQLPATLLYILIVSALNIFFTWGAFGLCRLVAKRIHKKAAVL